METTTFLFSEQYQLAPCSRPGFHGRWVQGAGVQKGWPTKGDMLRLQG